MKLLTVYAGWLGIVCVLGVLSALLPGAWAEAPAQGAEQQSEETSTQTDESASEEQKQEEAEPWQVRLRKWGVKALTGIGKGTLWLVVIVALCVLASRMLNWWLFGVTGGLSRVLRRFDLDANTLVTLTSLSRSVLSYVIFFVGLIVFLGKVGVSTVALTAGLAGMAGIAIGFGSQGIVRDFVSGAFVLLERHYALGDFVEVAGAAGFVERITIRTTTIRQVSGEVRCIPNGSISTIRRFPKGYMDAQVDIFLKASSDMDNARQVVDKVSAQLASEIGVLLETPSLLTTGRPGSGMPYLRYQVRTLPLQEWVANNEFVPHVKQALTEAGITLASLPPRVIFLTDVEILEKQLLRLKERVVEEADRD